MVLFEIISLIKLLLIFTHYFQNICDIGLKGTLVRYNCNIADSARENV